MRSPPFVKLAVVLSCYIVLGGFLGNLLGTAFVDRFLSPPAAMAIPQGPCLTDSASATAWYDPLFPNRSRFVKFRVTGNCDDGVGWGCSWTAYQTVWKSNGTTMVQVYQWSTGSGDECGGSDFVEWTTDFAFWGVGMYRVDIDVYDNIPLLNPTLLKHAEFALPISY